MRVEVLHMRAATTRQFTGNQWYGYRPLKLKGPLMTPFRVVIVTMAVIFGVPSLTEAQDKTLYITPTSDGLDGYITAAIVKKRVPILVSTVAENADYTLKASEVEIKHV